MNDESKIWIREYENRFAPDFYRLNEEWISHYFEMEDSDHLYLGDPQKYIIDKGGYILFAGYQNRIVGTCALINNGDNIYELSKMAVQPDMHGKHIGRLLGEAILEKAKSIGAKKVFLNSNRILIPAIELYKKLGFTEALLNSGLYKRSDIQMEIIL